MGSIDWNRHTTSDKGRPMATRIKFSSVFQRRILSSILIIATILPAGNGCTSSEETDQTTEWLILAGLMMNLPDYWARLYYIHPEAAADNTNIAFLSEATGPEHAKTGSKKIVLVPGWDVDDRNIAGYPSAQELRARALTTNWGHFVGTTEYNQLLTDGYEFYSFDYLTSDGIDKNGARLRQKLDAVFGSLTGGEVIVYAHSMGGVVTRFAMYEGSSAPVYVKAALLNGSPLHGSPWASPEFQKSLGVVYSQLSVYLTDTEGGSDLRWDNFDGKIEGASNPKLAALNAKTDRDSLFHLTYATPAESGGTSFTNSSPDSIGTAMRTACSDLNNFFAHDCLVPASSATLEGHTSSSTQDLGNYDHFEINMKMSAVRADLRTKINSL